MKKIVALALSLVMALALCTTAFAATAIGPNVRDAEPVENTEYALVKVLNAHDKVLDAYQIQTTQTNPATGGKTITMSDDYYTVATGDSYDQVLIDGKNVTYLQSVALNQATVAATKVATVKTAKAVKAHGDIWTTNDVALFVDADDNYYVPFTAGEAKYLNVGGKMVKAMAMTTEMNEQPHAFTAAVTIKDGETTYSDIKCSCGATYTKYATTPAKAKTTFGIGAYDEIIVNGDVNLYVAKTAAGTTNTTTTSPKTFDAGIAMYVGMSLMSVAGSAVVIGKKKEF